MITSNYQVDGDIYSYANKFFCDSGDDKPSNADAKDGLINGAILEETDTGKTYIFDKKANKWTEKAAGGGGGGGGSTTLAALTDVDISNPADGQTLVYNATSGKWENGSSGGGGGGSYIINDIEGTLDQTFASIKNASNPKFICKDDGSDGGYAHYCWPVTSVAYDPDDGYWCEVLTAGGVKYYSCSEESDYPTLEGNES